MPNFSNPSPPDTTSYWGFTPQKETLYGSECVPRKFLRIIDAIPGGGERVFHTYQDDPGNPDSVVVVETVTIDGFVKFATFGHTPYLETALCGLKGSIGLEDNKDLFLSQAAYRNYETRAKALLEVFDEKKLSFSSIFSSEKTQALKDELSGVLAMWEMLMNSGDMNPTNCISYVPQGADTPKAMRAKFEELEYRLLMGNHAPLPFKISQSDRERITAAFHG